MLKADRIRLQHMLDAASDAVTFTKRRKRKNLDADKMFLFSLVKAIEIIGEAASQVSAATKKARPEIAWAEIITMRHRLVHAYYDINTDTVWNTVKEDLPPLIAQLKAVLKLRE